MSDNFYLDDLLQSLREETTMERYWPLIAYREDLLSFLKEQGIIFRDDVTGDIIEKISHSFGDEAARLFVRFIHIYDFNKSKLREIKQYSGTEQYAPLSDLLRLPGVRILRAELYYNSGVTLEILANEPTAVIRDRIGKYIQRENRTETVPFVKEVNCHKEVAKMILHIRNTDF